MLRLAGLVICLCCLSSPLFAELIFTGSPVTLEAFGDGPGPSIQSVGGNPGGYLQLTDAVNSQLNFATFDLTDPGEFVSSEFAFDFILDPTDSGPSADGFSFSYASTSIYGSSGGLGAAPFAPEDPAAAGILGFGFDTWSNQGAFDDPNTPTGSDYSEISVFWDGALIARIDDTRLLSVPLTLDDAQWHSATGVVNFSTATVSLNVDGNPIFTDLSVPGLTPFESRIMFAGRTGGENEVAGVDNVFVSYTPIPEPSPVCLFALLLALVAGHRFVLLKLPAVFAE